MTGDFSALTSLKLRLPPKSATASAGSCLALPVSSCLRRPDLTCASLSRCSAALATLNISSTTLSTLSTDQPNKQRRRLSTDQLVDFVDRPAQQTAAAAAAAELLDQAVSSSCADLLCRSALSGLGRSACPRRIGCGCPELVQPAHGSPYVIRGGEKGSRGKAAAGGRTLGAARCSCASGSCSAAPMHHAALAGHQRRATPATACPAVGGEDGF